MEQRAEGVAPPMPGVIVLAPAIAAAPAVDVVVAAAEPAPAVAPRTTLERWLPLMYIGLITGAEIIFIECYCHWHGAQFLLPNPLKLYSPDNIHKLSEIGFDGQPTVMRFTAEILMWASLGVWSERVAGMVKRYEDRRPDLPHDLTEYIGSLGCHTSIAAAVMIVLKLSGFKIFSISLENFEATAGIAFILGYFGQYTEQLLTRIRIQVFGKKDLLKNKQAPK
jgi:hypothetical protein